MSTNDVPGAVAANNDALRMGCWAEHADDGTLIFVKSTEATPDGVKRVIYEMYDLAQVPVLFFQDAMTEDGFMKKYSWDPKNPGKSFGKWTWHDKTPFPWDKVIKATRPGLSHASVGDQLTAAQAAAKALGLERGVEIVPKPVDANKLQHLVDQMGPRGKYMMDRIQSAINNLPPDESVKEIQDIIASAK